jgi:hypothetical protein
VKPAATVPAGRPGAPGAAGKLAVAPGKVAPPARVARRRAGGLARRSRRLALARAAAEADAAIAAASAPAAVPAAAAPAAKAKVEPKAQPAEAPAQPSEAVKKAANSGDELDELMAASVGPGKRGSDLDKKLATVQKGDATAAAKAAAPAKAQPLSRSDIETAMKAVKDEMADCYAKTGKGGPVDLSIGVAPEGDVKSTVIKGEFAGTPTGSCVEKKVKATVFPASAGLNFNYRLVVK